MRLYPLHTLKVTQTVKEVLVLFLCYFVYRYHRLNRRFISYGKHDGNEFLYNDTVKMLSVSYFCELQHKTYI